MKTVNVLFLQALCASLQRRTVDWETDLTPAQWNELFAVAGVHHVLPMVYEAVVHSTAAQKVDPQFFATARQQTIRTVALQTVNTNLFLKLLQET